MKRQPMRNARNECDLAISTLLLLLALIISRSSLVVKNVIGIFWMIDLRLVRERLEHALVDFNDYT